MKDKSVHTPYARLGAAIMAAFIALAFPLDFFAKRGGGSAGGARGGSVSGGARAGGSVPATRVNATRASAARAATINKANAARINAGKRNAAHHASSVRHGAQNHRGAQYSHAGHSSFGGGGAYRYGGHEGGVYSHGNILTSPQYFYMPGNIYHPLVFPVRHHDVPAMEKDQARQAFHAAAQNGSQSASPAQASVSCIFTKISQSGVNYGMKDAELLEVIHVYLDQGKQEGKARIPDTPMNRHIQAAKFVCEH